MTYAPVEKARRETAQDAPSVAHRQAARGAGSLTGFSRKALAAAATLWFAVAASGQMIFVLYILSFYGRSAVRGDLEAWNRVMPKGHVAGDTIGNVAIMIHILIAAIVTIGGPLQLIPRVRTSFPAFHRWNGRVYFITVVVASITGLYMVWARSQFGSALQHVAISINAVLIVLAALLALRRALARQLAAHRRWALRLFILVSGVWFFRVGLMFWIAVNGGPVGFNPETFQGPALSALGFLQYLLPLAVLQLYFMAKEGASPVTRIATAGALITLTFAMGIGIVVATMGMWLPHIR
ncbi:MAG TPA: DUF2306 domain-containing protein [Janthinobacterium sp.]|jgi:hypothetical protein|nr:DUF2306 domain-containing protein [Janthinobacterium sp.]